MKKLFIFLSIIFITLNLFAQKDTVRGTYQPYDKKQEVTKRDTVVRVRVDRQKPGTVLGDFLYYLSPKKYDERDSVYPLYTDAASFYLHESNHVTQDERNENDSIAYQEKYWNQKYDIDATPKRYKRDTSKIMTKEVFGFHPFWMGTAYQNYNFTLLTRLFYFSYVLDPKTGDPKTTHYWNETKIIDLAHSYDCKVDLCITNFGQTQNRIFLTSEKAQIKLIANILNLLKKRNGDGVNINFESVPKMYKTQFSNFIKRLSESLQKANPNYKLSITIPAIDWRNAYDVATLKNYVDYFFLMGYDFYGKYSTVAGPTSLLFSGADWTTNNINNTINNYIEQGADPKSLILGLPYYGNEWVTKDGEVPSEKVKFVKARSYSYINSHYADKYVAHYDSTSHSIYYIFRNGSEWRQCWADNEQTLSIKYDYINEKKLGGLGIWALGYDNGFPELWTLIKNKFTALPDTSASLHELMSHSLEYDVTYKALRNINQAQPDYTNKFHEKIKKFWHVLILFFGIIMTFAIIGFIIAITDFDVRFVLFNKEVRVYIFFILLALVTMLILRLKNLIENGHVVLIVSIILGISAALILLKVGSIKKDKSGEDKP